MVIRKEYTHKGKPFIDIRMSYAEFLEEVSTSKEFNAPDKASHKGSLYFTGTKSFEDAISLHANGYAHAFETLNLPDLYTPQAQMMSYNDVAGATPDIGAYLSGNPENMIRFEIERAPKRRKIHMVFNCIYGADITVETAANYGAAIIDVCNSLKNYELKISCTWTSESVLTGMDKKKNTGAAITILVKDWHEPYIQNKILCMAHPSFLRRLVFRYQEIHSELWSYGYGQCADPIPSLFEPEAVVMPGLISNSQRGEFKNIMMKRIAEVHKQQEHERTH